MKIASTYFKKEYDVSKADLVGQGNFAQVFKVFDNQLNTFLAIRKVLKSQAEYQDLTKQRNINEELMKVKNENILQIYDIIDSKQFVWYITEYCQGGSLWDSLNRLKDNKMKEKDAMNIILQVSKGVQQLHNHRITHRDLKPQNILLKSKYVLGKPVPLIKLADFGLSTKKIIMETIAGTKQYIAPQQAKFQNYTNAVDVWSLGIICDQILHGTPFFSGQNNKQVFNKILKMPYKVRDQTIRQSIKTFLVSLLKKKPYQRPIIAVIRKNIQSILQQISKEQEEKKSDNQSSKNKNIYTNQTRTKPNPQIYQKSEISSKNHFRNKEDLKEKNKIQMIKSQGNIDEQSILLSDKKTSASHNTKQEIKPHYFKQTTASKSKEKLVNHNFGHGDQKNNFGLFKTNSQISPPLSDNHKQSKQSSSIQRVVIGSRYERLQNKFGGNLGVSYLPKTKNQTEISRSKSKEGIQFKNHINEDKSLKQATPKERIKQDDTYQNRTEKKKRLQRQGDTINQSMQYQSQKSYQSNIEDPKSSTNIGKNEHSHLKIGNQRMNQLKRSSMNPSGMDKYVKFERKRRNSNGLKSQQKRQIISIQDYVRNVQGFKFHLQDSKITTPLRDKYSFMPNAYLSSLDLSKSKNLSQSLCHFSKSIANLESRDWQQSQILFHQGDKRLRSKIMQCKSQFDEYKKSIKEAFFEQIDNQLESYLQKLLK